MNKFVIVLTTFPGDGDVESFARKLVELRVAACVNILSPVRSIYWWKGAVEIADERQLLIKTTMGSLARLERAIRKSHPYETPEFLVVQIQAGSTDYLSWLSDSVAVKP